LPADSWILIQKVIDNIIINTAIINSRLLEEAVFEHFDELKSNGLGSVLKPLKRLKKKPNPLLERSKKRS